MSEEPEAGMNLDPEMLAAYIDNRLTPEQRAEVEARLASDPDNHAVLLATLQAVDALSGAVPIDKVSDVSFQRPRRSLRWWIAGGVVAAAAVILAIIQPEILHRLLGNGTNPKLERLVAAVGNDRYFEPRLTGGFAYAPLVPVTRGPTQGAQNFALLGVVGEIQQSQQDTADSVHAWGVAQLLVGRFDDAIASLQRAVDLEKQAQIYSDLAAAYAARAGALSNAQDWGFALENATAAIELDPALAEPRFNKALALERLLLRAEAEKAWQEYLAIDPDSPWAREARAKLGAPVSSWERDRLGLEQSPTSSFLNGLIASNPQLVREWAEESFLKSWADAVIAHDPVTAAASLSKAREIIEAVTSVQGDRLALDAISAIDRHRDDVRVAQALQEFLAGRRLYLDGQFANSAEHYRRALPTLVATGSPYALWAQMYVALAPYFGGDLAAAHSNLTALSAEFQSSRYSIVQARRLWTLGIINVGRGRFDEALRNYRDASRRFARAHESEGVAGVESAMAEVVRELGDASWWDHQWRATASLPLVRLNRRHVILLTGTQGALSAGLVRTALAYQNETLHNATAGGGLPVVMAETFQWMYAVEQHLPDAAARSTTLQLAREWMASIADPDIKRRQEAELASMEADFWLHSDPGKSAAVAERAIEQFSAEGRVRRLPQLYLRSARARYGAGDYTSALRAVNSGLTFVEQQRVNLQDARLRLSYYEDKWGLIEEGILQHLSSGSPAADALMFLDQWRRPVLLQHRSHSPSIAAAAKQLPNATAVLVFAALPDRLSMWVIRREAITHADAVVARSAFEGTILRLKERMRGSQTIDQTLLSEIAGYLLAPVAKQLHDVDQLVVVADGIIAEVPFAALPWPDTQLRVVDRASVVLAPSVQRALAVATHPLRIKPGRALIAAVPQAATTDLPLLSGAQHEAQAVGVVYGADADVHDDGLTVDEFVSGVRNATVIHLATHAVANPLLPHLSRVYLSSSGNHPEGTLTASDIAALPLPGSLVILAGCNTASGSATRSEGVIGLASAFLGAGARAVVASLWPVDDRLSAPFQEQFHAAVRSGVPVGEALRRAQLWARANSTSNSDAFWATWSVTETSEDNPTGGTQ